MAKFKDLYDHVLPTIRGADLPLVDYHIRRVLRDFLKKTTTWREVIPVILAPGLTDYRISPASGSGQVGGVLSVVDPSTNRSLVGLTEGNRRLISTDPGDPAGWYQLYPGIITFDRPPENPTTLDVSTYKVITLDPSDDYFPDDVYDNYADYIANGVMAQFQAMPAKPWSDPTMATVNNTLYKKAMYALRARIRAGGGSAPTRVQSPLFAGRYGRTG